MRPLRQPRLSFALLLVAVLLVKAIVPAGWMPAQAGGLAITICTSEGVVDAWVDADGNIHTEKQPMSGGDQPCAFASLGAAADRADGPRLSHPLLPSFALPDFVAQPVAIGQGLAAPPPPATGPPLLN